MIHVDAQNQLFHLQTANTSYLFGLYKGVYPIHLYWGRRLQTAFPAMESFYDFSHAWRNLSAGDPAMGISLDTVPAEYSTFGSNDMRTPAFHAVYPDGTRLTELRYHSHTVYAGKRPLAGLPATYVECDDEAQTLELTLQDPVNGLRLVLSYTVFEQPDAITRHVRVENLTGDTVRLRSVLSAQVDFKESDYDFLHLPGAWLRERHPQRHPVFTGMQSVSSARGTSSCQHNPFFALTAHDATETHGDVYGFNLVYSGNFTAGVEADPYGTARAFIGINPFDFEYTLEAGDCFQAPEAVLVYSDQGLGGMSRIYHKLYRTRLCRGEFRDRERYIVVNNWEATGMNFNADTILRIGKKAAEVGVDMLVLDDGWFGHRDNDQSSLGDWYVDTRKLPNGLRALAEQIQAMGLKFGLWFEPEMISPDSDCYRAHPDWCIHVPNRTRSEGRNQLVMDLSRPEVCDYIIERLSAILDSAPIAYVKWDYNRNMSEIGSAGLDAAHQAELPHRYVLGLYRILETLTTRYPQVLFESCSSGGARFDPGMLYYMPQTWCSDETDAVERAYIQYGTSLCYPYCTMGAHVTTVPNHQVGRSTPLELRGHMAMQGQFGYELDLNNLNPDEIEKARQQIALYRRYGAVFHTGDLYRLVTPDSGMMANAFVAEDGRTVVMVVATLQATPNCPVKYIRLQGLEEAASYRCAETGTVYSGEVLMRVGVAYCPEREHVSRLLVFERV